MTQKLATRKSDSVKLDFGLTLIFDAHGFHAEGRADSPNYHGPIFEGLTSSDVTQTDVADNYVIPGPTPMPTGRALIKSQFLDVGMDTDPAKMNGVLVSMPIITAYLDDYTTVAGILYSDVGVPTSRIARLIAAAKAAGLIDDAFITSFLTNWVTLYPA